MYWQKSFSLDFPAGRKVYFSTRKINKSHRSLPKILSPRRSTRAFTRTASPRIALDRAPHPQRARRTKKNRCRISKVHCACGCLHSGKKKKKTKKKSCRGGGGGGGRWALALQPRIHAITIRRVSCAARAGEKLHALDLALPPLRRSAHPRERDGEVAVYKQARDISGRAAHISTHERVSPEFRPARRPPRRAPSSFGNAAPAGSSGGSFVAAAAAGLLGDFLAA